MLIPALALAVEPVREWKSKSGKPIIEASLDLSTNSDRETVYLRKDGKKYQIPFKNLSAADRAYVTQARANERSLAEDVGLTEVEDVNARAILPVPAGNRYALLIGVNRYARPIRSLEFCVNDMNLLAEILESVGASKENIFLMTDESDSVELQPTGANIRRQIESITRLMDENDQLTIAFSGHGVMIDDKSYLCPRDTDLEDQASVVSRDWAFEQLERCRAKQKIFIIDACRNELSFGGNKALGDARTLEDPMGSDAHGFILIASCDKGQQSWEDKGLKHGVFTHFLTEGLQGAAMNEDGFVSVLNLFQYASAKTKKYVFKRFNKVQVPTFRQGGEMTDFYLAKLSPDSFPAPLSVPQTRLPASPYQGERAVLTVDGVEYAFRWAPPGQFTLGSPEDEKGRWRVETQRQVRFTRGFWILETEVTQEMWTAVMGENPSDFKGDRKPVEQVSWLECQEFCRKLSRMLGHDVKLPTQEQWEYACRAGSTGPYAGDLDSMGWYSGNSALTTHDVGLKKPNAWGIYDMHGNVWEWCADYEDDSSLALRGGGWNNEARACRSAVRNGDTPNYKSNRLGLRILLLPTSD